MAVRVSPPRPSGAPRPRPRDEGHDLVACGGDGTVTKSRVWPPTRRRARDRADRCGERLRPPARLDRRRWLDRHVARTGKIGSVDLGRVEPLPTRRARRPHDASLVHVRGDRRASTARRTAGPTVCNGERHHPLRGRRAAHARTYKPHRFRLTVDGDVHDTTAWLVAIGNSAATPAGCRSPRTRARRRPARRMRRRARLALRVPALLPACLPRHARLAPGSRHVPREGRRTLVARRVGSARALRSGRADRAATGADRGGPGCAAGDRARLGAGAEASAHLSHCTVMVPCMPAHTVVRDVTVDRVLPWLQIDLERVRLAAAGLD